MRLLLIILMLLILISNGASATLNCTDKGSDGIADNQIIVATSSFKSNCYTDGIDDQIEINMAIDNSSTGGTVQLYDGVYNVNFTAFHVGSPSWNYSIRLKDNMNLIGNGSSLTTIKLIDNMTVADDINIIGTNQSVLSKLNNVQIKNLTVEGNWKNNSRFTQTNGSFAIKIPGGSNISMENLNIFNISYDSIWFHSYSVSNISMKNIRIIHTGHDGIRIDTGNENTLVDNVYIDIREIGTTGTENLGGNHGMRLISPSNSTVKNSILIGSGGNGIFTGASSGTASINNLFENNTLSSKCGDGIEFDSNVKYLNNITFKNNRVIDIPTNCNPQSTQRGMHIYGTGNITDLFIISNTFENIAYDGIRITSTSINSSIYIKNNIINKSGTVGIGGNGLNNTVPTMKVSVSYNLISNSYSGNMAGIFLLNSSNIFESNPQFVNITRYPLIYKYPWNPFANNDYHLKSLYGRWSGTTLVNDIETSPAIGAGDPASDNSRSPWGGVIEMGAYGNTPYASRPKPPEILGFINDWKNESPLTGSTVTLYHSNGTSTGSSSTSGADGRFQFSNIPSGVYYVNATKDRYVHNYSSNFTMMAGITVNAGNVTLVNRDVNGDGEKNLLDLNEIIRRYLDLNNDGKVDAADLFMVSGYFNTFI